MKRLIILLTGAIILSTGIVFSQTEEDRVNFLDGEFFFAEEDYPEALAAFRKVYKGEFVNNANLNYLIGSCYLRINGQKDEAIPYLEKAVTKVSINYKDGSFKEESAPQHAFLLLGNAYRIAEDLDKAIENYKKYINLLKENQLYERQFANQQLENCARAKEAILKPANLKKENIGNLHNSQYDNYNAVRSGNGKRIAYMSEQRFYDGIYFAELSNGNLSNPINITPQVQSDGDQFVTALSFDGNTMYLSKISYDDADIMTSNYVARRWTKSTSIGKPINSRYFESHASISADGKRLYFLSNRKESIGGMDVFFSDLQVDGKTWSDPVNLGPNINTALNEGSPFISSDGKTLYFSSEGHSNIGGYDLFYSKLDENNNWTSAIPYPYPLNTTDDDIFFFPFDDGVSGYISRIEADGLGGEDIYSVSILPEGETIAEIEVADDEVETTEVAEEIAETTEVAEEIVEATENIVLETETPVEDMPTIKYYIKPIFFGFDSYSLSENAKSKLTAVKEVMDAFPGLKIEVIAHTDALGSESYNQILSARRAKAVHNHLIELGVPESNLSIKAEGENNPVAINKTSNGMDSAEGRKLNRRVQFKILSTVNELIILEAVKVPENLRID